MTNNTNEKALGRESEGSKKRTNNKDDFSSKDTAQMELNLAPEKNQQLRIGSKIENMLRVFLSGISLNRFEAEEHHDHCLHSTVSTLQNGYGIKIDRKSETVPCLRGRSTVRCMCYWLDTAPDNLAAARALLAMLGAA